jgi:predicted naringenin-chalcone synthase
VFLAADGVLIGPSTGVRNQVYRAEAPALFAAAATDALERAGVAASEVTHVVTVSCTGFFAPGPDFLLVRDLGIPPTAERSHLGFMGCAAAIPALRTAAQICAARPDAVVLVVCAELCSLHLRASSDPDQIVASAVFADGAAAAVVSTTPRLPGPVFELDGFATAVTADGESDMDWTIGDEGFRMVLTAEVPRIVGREIRDAVAAAGAPDPAEVLAWAVHPGGRSILDRVQSGLALADAALAPSREVLRAHGNMSSATVLFILQRLLADPALPDGAPAMAIAFGPGLTVETARLTRRAAAG